MAAPTRIDSNEAQLTQLAPGLPATHGPLLDWQPRGRTQTSPVLGASSYLEPQVDLQFIKISGDSYFGFMNLKRRNFLALEVLHLG